MPAPAACSSTVSRSSRCLRHNRLRILFVSNGHGEMAIAARIASDVRRLGDNVTAHFPLVGEAAQQPQFPAVGPQRALPSGGLVAMGNVRAFARDLRAGFLPLWFAQRRFLRQQTQDYAVVVAVGDAYCLWTALAAKRKTLFVGTAKSVHVAPYGALERRILRRAARVFVRDRATSTFLCAAGVHAESPGNVIADLAQSDEVFEWGEGGRVAILPGSRENAYENAARIGRVLQSLESRHRLGYAVSIAPGLDSSRMLSALGVPARAWSGALGAMISGATVAIGQAGTANEAAAASGVPVVALGDGEAKKEDWYRMRQRRLLDGALAMISPDPQRGAEELGALLDDPQRRAEMGRIGRERMGAPGAASAIAAAILETARA